MEVKTLTGYGVFGHAGRGNEAVGRHMHKHLKAACTPNPQAQPCVHVDAVCRVVLYVSLFCSANTQTRVRHRMEGKKMQACSGLQNSFYRT